MPVILVNKPLPGLAVDTVVADHAAGGRLAAEHLLAAGCRRLALVSSAARTASLMGRLNAFRTRVADAGLRARVWQDGPTDYRAGREAARALLAEEPFDGVFCVTDLLALGFLDAARSEFGRRVPEDLSVIGFDDIPQAGWRAYELTTFCQPVGDLADAVMAGIRRRTEAPATSRTVSTIPVRLVARATVRGLAPTEALS